MAYTKRIQILLESEINELYSPPSFSVEERRHYFSLNDQEAQVAKSIRKRSHRCYFVALLGYFKSKPVVLNPRYGQMEQDLQFIAREQFPGPGLRRFSLDQKQRDRLYQKIYGLLKYQNWHDQTDRDELVAHMQRAAKCWVEPRYLFDTAIEYLSSKRVGIPKYTALQLLVSQAMANERQSIMALLAENLTTDLAATLTSFLGKEGSLPLSKLRQSAKSFAEVELAKELAVNRQVQPWISAIDAVVDQLSLSQKNRQHFASMVDYYGSKISRFDDLTQYLYLLCYLQERAEKNREQLADGFVYHVKKVRDEAKLYAKDAAYRDWEGAANNIGKAADLLYFFVDDSIDDAKPFGSIKRQSRNRMSRREIESMCLYLRKQRRTLDEYQWEYFDKQTQLIDSILRPIFLGLEFEATDKSLALTEQLMTTQTELSVGGWPRTFDRRLITKKQQDHLIDENNNVIANRFEWLLYLRIPNKLKGHLHLPGIIKYRALQDDLISNTRWKSKKTLLEQSMLPRMTERPKALIKSLSGELHDKLTHVAQRIDNGDKQNVILSNRTGKTTWRLPSTGMKSALNNPFFEKIKPINIADVLRYVHQDTGCLDYFDHVLPVQPKALAKMDDLLAVLIGNGTNYGAYGMAHISDRNYDRLQQMQANYVRPETLNSANDAINNATAKLDIFKYYNIQKNVIHASADGQKFESRLETFKTRYSSKYFGTNKGVSSITLVANHAALNARIIGSNEHESHYIFDLLQNNTSDIRPDVLSTDTHGVNHVNFALLDLFGYRFAPRYAKITTVIEEMFDVQEGSDGCVKMRLRKPIKTDVIIDQWETIQRIVISLKEKTMTQATLVRKLSGYAESHPLLQALSEYNRMIKALYLLDYIDDQSLRSYVQRALNRGEAYHQLRRAVASVNGNRFRGSSDYEISLWNECARLLTNAIIYFNSKILSLLLTYFGRRRDEKNLALTKMVSPVAWLNINLNGTYSFNAGQNMIDMDEIVRIIAETE